MCLSDFSSSSACLFHLRQQIIFSKYDFQLCCEAILVIFVGLALCPVRHDGDFLVAKVCQSKVGIQVLNPAAQGHCSVSAGQLSGEWFIPTLIFERS
jgi:hypothetical protein